jgi:hypothetical protein
MTDGTNMDAPMPAVLSPARSGSLTGLAAVLALLLPDISISANAEVAVTGPINAVQVDARNSSVAEILTALGATFDVRYRASTDLNRPVTGTFKGPVLKVMSGLLKDYDYVVKSSAADGIEVTIIKFNGPSVDNVSAGRNPPGLFPPKQPTGRNPAGSAYPAELFQPKPPPGRSPVQGSDKVVPSGGSPYPPELFAPRPPLGQSSVGVSR